MGIRSSAPGRRFALAAAALACVVGCKDSQPPSGRTGTDDQPATAAPAVAAPSSARAQAAIDELLGELTESAGADGFGCGSYGDTVRGLFANLATQWKTLGASAEPAQVLAGVRRLAEVLATERDGLAPPPADDADLAALHDELAAALMDLQESLIAIADEIAGGSAELSGALENKLVNGAENIGATIARMRSLCST